MPAKKFIPDGDRDFAKMSHVFERTIAENPAAYCLSADVAAEISEAVREYRDALALALRRSTRTQETVAKKDEARCVAEAIVRKYGRLIRANDEIPPWVKASAGVHERATRLKPRECPETAPLLRYLGSEDGLLKNGRRKSQRRRKHLRREHRNGAVQDHRAPVHVLEFLTAAGKGSSAKPFGAVRLEVFIEMVRPGERVPRYPGETTGRPWYLRSFTTNPLRVRFPMPSEPRMIIYWARWADAKGETGPWSNAAMARVEGWSAAESAADRAAA